MFHALRFQSESFDRRPWGFSGTYIGPARRQHLFFRSRTSQSIHASVSPLLTFLPVSARSVFKLFLSGYASGPLSSGWDGTSEKRVMSVDLPRPPFQMDECLRTMDMCGPLSRGTLRHWTFWWDWSCDSVVFKRRSSITSVTFQTRSCSGMFPGHQHLFAVETSDVVFFWSCSRSGYFSSRWFSSQIHPETWAGPERCSSSSEHHQNLLPPTRRSCPPAAPRWQPACGARLLSVSSWFALQLLWDNLCLVSALLFSLVVCLRFFISF